MVDITITFEIPKHQAPESQSVQRDEVVILKYAKATGSLEEPLINIGDQLKQLSDLHDAGVLDDDEFKKAKSKVVS
jgi:hypothetical protein